jgi:hypothetical protein
MVSAIIHHNEVELRRLIVDTDAKCRFPESDDAVRAVILRWGEDAVDAIFDQVRDRK